MPAYRFSWVPFDDKTITALASAIGYRGSSVDDARGFLDARVKRPNDDFIRETRDVIARVWIPQHEAIGKSIVEELIDMRLGPGNQLPTDAQALGDFVLKARNSSRFRHVLAKRMIGFGDAGGDSDYTGGEGFIPQLAIVVPAKQPAPTTRPLAHQEDAWSKLDEHLRAPKRPGVFKGVLVMPTGAGKTYTAVSWLLRRWIDAGNRVLWLAHREELLDQAARTFARYAALAKSRERIRIRTIASGASAFHMVDDADDVMCCSVASVARAPQAARDRLLSDPRLFVVIDEAHHAPAKSYRDVIQDLSRLDTHSLLGLTATPTRTAERERPELSRLFENHTIYEVKPRDLIARELLARPVPVTVRTAVDAEANLTEEDRKHLTTFHKPSEEMLKRLGSDVPRNRRIAWEYARNRTADGGFKYGKTLVFTTDVQGAVQLKEEFQQQLKGTGVEVEYVASYRPDAPADGDRFDRAHILKTYADPKSGLDVLINVEMLTEGVDLPATKTVFLARPTSSEILFRQMVGRALRGPQAGGHKEAYVVSFEDHWSTFTDLFDTTQWLGQDYAAEAVPEPSPAKPSGKLEPVERLSWDTIRALSSAIRASLSAEVDTSADVFEAVPDGMFVLEYEAEGEDIHHVIHVYEHQKPCWDALAAAVGGMSPERLRAAAATLEEEYFGDCDLPAPSPIDVATMIERLVSGDAFPEYVPLAGRSDADPRALAKLAVDGDLRQSELKALLEQRYSAFARIVYPTMLDFRRAFDDAVRELEAGEVRLAKEVPIFEPPPGFLLPPGDHDLERLLSETLQRGGELLGQKLPHQGPITWSKRPLKKFFAKAWWQSSPGTGRIRVNVLMNSSAVSEETLRYLLWHEYLHLYLMGLHTPEFRRLERLWPDYTNCDREMDTLHERYGVTYW